MVANHDLSQRRGFDQNDRMIDFLKLGLCAPVWNVVYAISEESNSKNFFDKSLNKLKFSEK